MSFPWKSCNSGTRGSFSSPWERSSWAAASSIHRKWKDMHSSGLCSRRKLKREDSGDSETVEEREVGGTHNTPRPPKGAMQGKWKGQGRRGEGRGADTRGKLWAWDNSFRPTRKPAMKRVRVRTIEEQMQGIQVIFGVYVKQSGNKPNFHVIHQAMVNLQSGPGTTGHRCLPLGSGGEQ